jgi:hypothetical protein
MPGVSRCPVPLAPALEPYFFLEGASLSAGQSTAPPKNGPGVSQARVPTHIRVGDDHAAAA